MIIFLILSHFTAVYPEQNETVEDFFICGTFDTLIPEDSIKILVNKKKIEGSLIYSGKTFTFIPNNKVKNGKKILTVIIGRDTVSQWICTVKRKRTLPILSGNFRIGGFTYLNNNPSDTIIPKFNSWIGLNLSAFSRLKFKGYFNTRGVNNRISIGYNDSLFKIRVLHINPEFSPLLLKDVYMNGIDLSIGKHKGVSFVLSKKKRLNKNSYIFGVNTYMVRNTFKSHLGIVRVLDDTTLASPSDNLIIGTGLSGMIMGYKINTSGGMSFWTRDIYGESLSDSFQLPKWIFYLNRTTIPLNPLGLTSGAFDFSISKDFLLIRLRRVGYSFVNNGAGGITNDRLSFIFRDRFTFNKFSFFGGYRFWRNNLSNINIQTRRYYGYDGGINLYGGEIGFQYSWTKADSIKTPNIRYFLITPVIKFIKGRVDIRKISTLYDIDGNIFLYHLPFSLSSKIYWHKISSNLWLGGELNFQKNFIRASAGIENGTNSRRMKLGSGINIMDCLLNIDYTLKYLNSTHIFYNYFRVSVQYYKGFTY